MARVKVQIEVTCMVRRDDESNAFVSFCPEFAMYSAGNTELEALEAIRSAVELFLRYNYERSKLGEILQEKGLRFTTQEDAPPWLEGTRAEVGEAHEQQIPIQVPFYLLRPSSDSRHWTA